MHCDKPAKKDFNFIGYTFKHNDENNERLLMVNALEKLEKTHSSMFRKPQTAMVKQSKENNNKTDYVRYHIDDFMDHEHTSRSKEPLQQRESFKENTTKALKQFLKQAPNNRMEDCKQYIKEAGYLPLKKPSASKSPGQVPTKKHPTTATQQSHTKLDLAGHHLKIQPSVPIQSSFNNTQKLTPPPNFTALIQSIKQKEHSKEREVTPRSFKASDNRPSDPKKPNKTIGVKFREYLK